MTFARVGPERLSLEQPFRQELQLAWALGESPTDAGHAEASRRSGRLKMAWFSSEETRGIVGENFLRAFESIWGGCSSSRFGGAGCAITLLRAAPREAPLGWT
jgi:hypothetical protein